MDPVSPRAPRLLAAAAAILLLPGSAVVAASTGASHAFTAAPPPGLSSRTFVDVPGGMLRTDTDPVVSTNTPTPVTSEKARKVIVGLKRAPSAAQEQAVPELRDAVPLPGPADSATEAAPHVLTADSRTDAHSIAQQLADDPSVEYAQPNRHYLPATNDQYFSKQWNLHSRTTDIDIDYPEARGRQQGKKSVLVAVIDTGVNINHPDLKHAIYTNAAEAAGVKGVDDDKNGYVDDVHGWDFANKDATVYDNRAEDEHGTHVAGVIAANAGNGIGIAGVAPGVTILPLKFIGSAGGWTDDAIAALAYAKKAGAHVINTSWGGYGADAALDAALADTGALIVAAAGNDGLDTDREGFFPAASALPNVISVGAVDAAGRVPSWSNRGVKTVDLLAPGVAILSTVPGGYLAEEGTSMAAPHVAGVAALLASTDAYATPGTWNAATAAQRILAGVSRKSEWKKYVATGGMVNAAYVLGALPVNRVSAGLDGGRLKVTWTNPRDAGFGGVEVRLLEGAVGETRTGGALLYAGTGTSVRLPKLAAGRDHTVVINSSDASGYRPPVVYRLLATRVDRVPGTAGMRVRLVTRTSGKPVAGAVLRLVSVATPQRVVCEVSTNRYGAAACPARSLTVRTGAVRWRYLGKGSLLPTTSTAMARR